MTRRPHRQRRVQRFIVLKLALIFLLQTFAWSAMPVYASDADEQWVAICTSEGIKWIALNDGGGPLEGTPSHAPGPTLVDHCDLCVFAQGLGMAPASVQLYESKRRILALPVVVADYAVASTAHRPQQPRAPPVS